MAENRIHTFTPEQARAADAEYRARAARWLAEAEGFNLNGAGPALYHALRQLLDAFVREHGECGCGGCSSCYAVRVLDHVERKRHAHGPYDNLPPCETEIR